VSAYSGRAPADEETFVALYERFFARVWAYAVGRVGRQSAEDVVAETFAVAWRRRADIPPDPLPWLIAVARNVIREAGRAQTQQLMLMAGLQDKVPVADSFGDEVAEGVAIRAQVLEALASLSLADQDLLILVAWHGLNSAQAAAALRCSQPAFFVRLHRARRRLERAIGVRSGNPAAANVPPADTPLSTEA
jgi:RNA polymerase sigma-70 factor, ECF subfamily